MTSKIRELKDTLVAQNEMIVTLRTDRDAVRDMLKHIYLAMVKYKPDFVEKVAMFSDVTTPSIRAEDLMTLSPVETIKNIGSMFTSLTTGLADFHTELSSIYKELDQATDEAMERWHTIRAQETALAKSTFFRDHSAIPSQDKRAKTPDLPLGNLALSDDSHLTPPTSPDPSGKSATGEIRKVEAKKGHAKTLEKVLAGGYKAKTIK